MEKKAMTDMELLEEKVRNLELENEALRDTIICVGETLDEFIQNRQGSPFKECWMALYMGRISGIIKVTETNVAWALEHGFAVDHRTKKSPGC